ncbi:MAG TPA: glycosyltransferase [Rhizomicrobium sp.]|nr:glycosyltransferase [Rhizomicrobium sp.]
MKVTDEFTAKPDESGLDAEELSSSDDLPAQATGGATAETVRKDPKVALKADLREATKRLIGEADRSRDMRDWAGARAGYEEALRLDPTLQHIWIQLGHARKESGDHAAAETAYREALKLKPNDADGHLQLGHLLKIRNQLAGAMEAYSRALALEPGLLDARNEIEALKTKISTNKAAAPRSFTPAPARYPKQAKTADAKTLYIAFDVSDLMHYFRNARLPTGIQRVQIEVIRAALEAAEPGIQYSIVCFTKETDFWIEIPPSLFNMLANQAVAGGDHQAPEWLSLLAALDATLTGKQYFSFVRGTVLLNLGTSWWLQNYFLNVRLAKSLFGIQYVPFVHDFIPVMAPEHCVSELRQDFITWAIGAFDHADHFLVNSKATLADLQTVSKKLGYGAREAAVVPLDADFRKTLTGDAIWDEVGDPDAYLAAMGLEKGKYVLFVSTIESRKNHIAAFSVWLKLIKKHGMKNTPKLVCVGNPGWLNDAAYSKLAASELLMEQVLMLSKISDGALSVLYENAVCTLYPSSYEGWGLPVTEALCYHKVPIVSKVSSLPEAGGPFAEYFDVESEKDLLEAVERIVYDEEYRSERENKIAQEFRPRTWAAISAQIIGQLREWKKTAPPPAQPRPGQPPGVWPLEAEMGVLHPVASNTSSTLWAGLKSGEIYRNGPGWWWPEHWGCWIKNQGPAMLAFLLEGVAGAGIQIYLGLRGIQGKSSICTIKADGGNTLSVPLAAEQNKVVSLALRPSSEEERLIVINFACDASTDFSRATNGIDFRTCGIGVRWFYACREDDLLGRLKMVEALAIGDVSVLQPVPKADFLLHT